MSRLYLLTFEGKRSPDAKLKHAHESAWPMTVPLVVLATMSVFALFYGLPLVHTPNHATQTPMENFLSPVFASAESIIASQHTVTVEHAEGLGPLMGAYGIALVIAWIGGGAAFFLYTQYFPRRVGQPLPAPLRSLQKFALNKFYVDELYDLILIRPIKFISFLFYKVIDAFAIDTIAVRGTAWVTARVGSLLRLFQTGDAQSYAAVMALALLAGVAYAVIQVVK